MSDKIVQNKADILKALAHPIRLKILDSLRDGERCVCEIIEIVEAEQSNVSQHLAVLKKMGLLASRKHGLKVIYRVGHDEVIHLLNTLERLITTQMEESMALLEGLKKKRAVNQ